MDLGHRQALPGQEMALLIYELAMSPSLSAIPRGCRNSDEKRNNIKLSPGLTCSLTSVQVYLIYSLLTAVDQQDLIHRVHLIAVRQFI